MVNKKLIDVFEVEKKKREQAARKSASDVVGSWGGEDLSQEAVNNYVKKVQSVYDAEAQQRAAADAEFQRSLRYLPQQFKAAGLYGSGQSESTLAQMNIAQNNQQNKIVADTNQKVQTLQNQYNTDVKIAEEEAQIADEEAKIRVDNLANIISTQSWENRSIEDWDNAVEYLKDGGYSDEDIQGALKQIRAFNPELGKQLDYYNAINKGTNIEYSKEEANKSKLLTMPNADRKIRYQTDFYVNFAPNNKTYRLRADKVVGTSLDAKLDEFAKTSGIENKQGTVVYYKGKLYVQSGQNKGWRNVTFTDYGKNTGWTKDSYNELISLLSSNQN